MDVKTLPREWDQQQKGRGTLGRYKHPQLSHVGTCARCVFCHFLVLLRRELLRLTHVPCAAAERSRSPLCHVPLRDETTTHAPPFAVDVRAPAVICPLSTRQRPLGHTCRRGARLRGGAHVTTALAAAHAVPLTLDQLLLAQPWLPSALF